MAGIRAIGWYVPEKRESAAELAERHGLSADAIREFGLLSRTKAGPGDRITTMGARATRAALAAAGLGPNDVDLLIFVGMTRDHGTPWVAAFGVLHDLGATRAAGFDLASRCAAVHDALWLAAQLVRAKTHRHVVVCSADRFDYLFAGKKISQISELAYAAGAAAAVVSADAKNTIAAFSHLTNADLSFHAQGAPLAGGSIRPPALAAVAEEHLWRSDLTVGQMSALQTFLRDADAHNIRAVARDAELDGIDYVVTSPLHIASQKQSLARLGIATEHLFFTLPLLGHLGPADSLLGLGVPIAHGRTVGRRVVMSTRTLFYANAVALRSTDDDLGIAVSGEGVEPGGWPAG